jgi:2-C-methyl-D-erythritol 2,4-cyclodiphosphate synthase
MKVGIGYDVHRLVENKPLIIGGVKIPYTKGLLGHSDADVLIHAIMDSLLGAMCLGDIGKLFPDTSDKYKNISSIKLLSHVGTLLVKHSYEIGNIDSIIIAQEPKLSPYIPKMRQIISSVLKTDINSISIKATTEEGLGFTGTKQGIASQSICLLNNIN